MELVFRKLPPAESLEPRPGEIYLVPTAQQRERRDLARLVLEAGPAALVRGEGAVERLVIAADPKFDDMLAAHCVHSQLENRTPPAGCKAFADYAALLREGQRPTKLRLEETLEGVFLAIRGSAEKPLTDAETAKHFLTAWGRMADVIFKAATEGKDPFATSFLPGRPVGSADRAAFPLKSLNRDFPSMAMGAGFLREQSFLAKDLGVYREDVARGERWEVSLPGAPAKLPGLLLRQPKSLLFKYWTRSQCSPPMNGPYPFLAVASGQGQWVFSTEPGQKLSLKGLSDLLQAAERKQAPDQAERDPWFDGQAYQHTIAASPQGGTRLSEAAVLRLVRKWCRARQLDAGRKFARRARLAACTVALLAVVSYLGFLFWPARGNSLEDFHDLFVLSVGVSEYKNIGTLRTAAGDADALAAAFKKQEGVLFTKVTTKVLKNENATRGEIIDTGFGSWLLQQQTPTKRSLVIVTFSGHGFIEPGTNRYHFAPQDYDRNNQGSTGIFLADLQRYLASLPCPVLLVFDTCHSGAVNENDPDEPDSPENLLKTIQKSVVEAGNKKGLVVMAACARYQKANETTRWGHGALTLAMLEALEGKHLYLAKDLYQTPLPKPTHGSIVTLQDLDKYVSDRVEILASEISAPKYRRQAVKTYASPGVALDQIPMAVYGSRELLKAKEKAGN